MDPAQAVAAPPNAAMAHLALTRVAHLREGETVLVHGAALVLLVLASVQLSLPVDELLLSDAAEAYRRLEARQVPGRTVLTV